MFKYLKDQCFKIDIQLRTTGLNLQIISVNINSIALLILFGTIQIKCRFENINSIIMPLGDCQ